MVNGLKTVRISMTDIGIFCTTIAIENPEVPGTVAEILDVIVDTGSEYTSGRVQSWNGSRSSQFHDGPWTVQSIPPRATERPLLSRRI
jgi:hypothetical protein